MKVIAEIKAVLNRQADIQHQFESEKLLHIYSSNRNDLLTIFFGDREHMLEFKEWHWHFKNDQEENDELIEAVTQIITNNAYLKVSKRKGVPYKWDLIINYSPDLLKHNYKTGLFKFPIFARPEIEYVRFEFKS